MISDNPFSPHVRLHFENELQFPPILSPEAGEDIEFIPWAEAHQKAIANVIKEYGVVVFSGFGLKKEDFSDAFTAATGIPPEKYPGDSPRQVVGSNIYKSTAVADGRTLPLHQEVAGNHAGMPKYISFFCVTPPAPGTGQTVIGKAKDVSAAIENSMPDFWESMCNSTLTYTSRYLPSDSWRTRWIKWLNPSHATIQQRFGTEHKKTIKEKCQQEELSCRFDGGWVVVTRSGVPATIDRDGATLICNQICVDKLNSKLCGGWINYCFARLLLYPTSNSMQYDIEFDDGTPIYRESASTILAIQEEHQIGRDWLEGDLMILDNVTTMHGKSPHSGPREILVAMGGSILEDSL